MLTESAAAAMRAEVTATIERFDAGMCRVLTKYAPKRDLLDMAYINSLPQPFTAKQLGGWWWPVHDMDVQTGVVRVDTGGLLCAMHIGDLTCFRDASGQFHQSEAFYSDATPEERGAPIPTGEAEDSDLGQFEALRRHSEDDEGDA